MSEFEQLVERHRRAVLGGGTPAFPDGAIANLELLGARTSDDSDNVLVHYAVRRG